MKAVAATDRRLLDIAIDHFGRLGLDGASTRAIAKDAGTPMSSITYHFGGKDGLYLACADFIGDTMHERLAPLVAGTTRKPSRDAAGTQVEALLGGLVVVMMQEDVAPLARFVVREQMNPTPVFDVLYEKAMRHVVEPIVASLLVAGGGRLGKDEARLRAFSLIGHVFALRFGRAALMRVTGWKTVGRRETALARDAVVANVRAVLAAIADGKT